MQNKIKCRMSRLENILAILKVFFQEAHEKRG